MQRIKKNKKYIKKKTKTCKRGQNIRPSDWVADTGGEICEQDKSLEVSRKSFCSFL